MKFDVLLFDLGGVLIDFAGFDELAAVLPDEPTREEVRDLWIHSDSVAQFERGEIDPRHFADGVIEELGLDLTPDRFLSKFVEWVRGPYPGALSLINRIKSGFLVACLSNSNELHTSIHRKAIEGVIDTCFFSNEIGSVKPEREIFEHVIGKLRVAASRIAFFDDTSINVEGAAEAGMTAYQVDGVPELESELERLGLIDGPGRAP